MPNLHSRVVYLLCFLLLTGCNSSKPALYFHDRHRESYEPVKMWAEENPGMVLILLDYHHDAGPGPDMAEQTLPFSFNWVGALISEDVIDTVLWVSGKNLEMPNINARKAWLERKISPDSEKTAEKKRQAIQVITWEDLPRIVEELQRPLAVSIDLDILTIDPGPNPDKFLEEILTTSLSLKPVGITLALSAAYQLEAKTAWKWLEQSYNSLNPFCSTPVWTAGIEDPPAESLEEETSWAVWQKTPALIDFGKTFAPGADLWNHAPASFWQSLSNAIPRGDDTSSHIISGLLTMTRSREKTLSDSFSEERMKKIKAAAVEAVEQTWQRTSCGKSSQREPPAVAGAYGIAVRFISKTTDRGCFALYQGIDEPESAAAYVAREAGFTDPRYPAISAAEAENLEIEISIFSAFETIADPYDFIPGKHSLVAEYTGGRTLLQAGIAAERNLSRQQFLDTLARKAGYKSSQDMPEPRFSRAETIFRRSPFYPVD